MSGADSRAGVSNGRVSFAVPHSLRRSTTSLVNPTLPVVELRVAVQTVDVTLVDLRLQIRSAHSGQPRATYVELLPCRPSVMEAKRRNAAAASALETLASAPCQKLPLHALPTCLVGLGHRLHSRTRGRACQMGGRSAVSRQPTCTCAADGSDSAATHSSPLPLPLPLPLPRPRPQPQPRPPGRACQMGIRASCIAGCCPGDSRTAP